MTREAFENAIVGELGDRRLDQCADPSERHRRASRRLARQRRLGAHRPRSPAARSTCSRPAASSARTITAPAACRRSWPSCSRRGLLPHPEAHHRQRQDDGENCKGKRSWDREVIRTYDKPIVKEAGFLNLKGNLFDSAIMKTSVISEEFRERYLSNPDDPDAFEGTRRRVRRARGLSRAHQRSGARHRRAHRSWSSAAPGRSAIRAAPRW